jgi:hypothetical protein
MVEDTNGLVLGMCLKVHTALHASLSSGLKAETFFPSKQWNSDTRPFILK